MSRRSLNILGILILMGITAAVSVVAYIYTVGGSGEPSTSIEQAAPTLDLSSVTLQAQIVALSTQLANAQATSAALAAAEVTADPQIAALSTQLADAQATNAALVAAEVTADPQIAALSTQLADAQATNAALVAQLAASAEATAEATTVPPTQAPSATPLPPTAKPPTQAPSATPLPPTAKPTLEPTAEVAAAPAATLFRIVSAESEARFTLTEDLRGAFTTVVGKTSEVAGDIFVDFANPSASKVGEIVINARTLATDNDFRNRALRSEILQSAQDAYEFIRFTPSELIGLPASLSVGEEVTFEIAGNLTVRDITQAVTFSVTAKAESADRLTGTGSTTVTRAQFNLNIPNVPNVANVSDEVTLEIDFVATKAG